MNVALKNHVVDKVSAYLLVTNPRDRLDLDTYMTIPLGNGQTIHRIGTDRYVLRDPAVVQIPNSWIEEWIGS